MNPKLFIDYYEVLQLSPNADFETVEKVFRVLAKRLHPDNDRTGNIEKFEQLMSAYEVLSTPAKRAAYDLRYDRERFRQTQLARELLTQEQTAREDHESDRRHYDQLLNHLYVAKKRNPADAGIGIYLLEKLMVLPQHQLQFYLWYLKEKSWIRVNESGQYEITASGVDIVIENSFIRTRNHLLPEGYRPTESTDPIRVETPQPPHPAEPDEMEGDRESGAGNAPDAGQQDNGQAMDEDRSNADDTIRL